MQLQLLGGFRLSVDGAPVATTIPVQRLLAYLGLHRTANRHQVAGALWPDFPEQRAHGSLRTALWRAQALRPGVVRTADHAMALDVDVEVDVDVLLRCAGALRRGEDRPEWRAALLVGEGELLPGWYDDWVLLERERLRQLRLHALEASSGLLLRQGCFGEALDLALAALRAEPLRESAHRLLVEIHLREGNRSEALRQYAEYAELLRREIGEDPSPRMTAMVATTCRADPAPAARSR